MKEKRSHVRSPIKRTPYTRPPVKERGEASNSQQFLQQISNTSGSLQSDMEGDSAKAKWTKEHWLKLEQYYTKHERDHVKAGTAFYYGEAFNTEEQELWTKEYVLWRCRCLDTYARSHKGSLPSERTKP